MVAEAIPVFHFKLARCLGSCPVKDAVKTEDGQVGLVDMQVMIPFFPISFLATGERGCLITPSEEYVYVLVGGPMKKADFCFRC